jgi:2,4-dienoyl-CoA reductase-like NADH-dependent reductase (Old Yellow Enzyme family)
MTTAATRSDGPAGGPLAEPLTLPCGATLPNRLAKAAMTEGLATADGIATDALCRLYRTWAEGGAGLLITGNVIVDRDHLERPGNVVIHGAPGEEQQAALARWSGAATSAGNAAWVQLSHAGRQTMKKVNPHPKAPSAIKLGLPGGQFGEPVALTEAEIGELPGRFATAAAAVLAAGFGGVQVHAAHGYLLSEFLSPRANRRNDAYGGSAEKRARLLLDTIAAVRAATGPGFAVAVKLNSADFQKGGFAFEDSLQVARWLEEAGVDLIEISGGTYEQPRLLGVEGLEPAEEQTVAASTRAREAYFVDFALAMRESVKVPLMVTGGFRTRAAMEQALAEGVDLIGLGRPLCVQTDGPARLLAGADSLPSYETDLGLLPKPLRFLRGSKLLRTLDTFGTMYWFYAQLDLLGKEGHTVPELSPFAASRRIEGLQKQLLAARRG